MKSLAGLLFDALCAMSLLVVIGTIATPGDPRPRDPAIAVVASQGAGTPSSAAAPPWEPIPVPSPQFAEPRSKPVGVSQSDIPRVGYRPPASEPGPDPSPTSPTATREPVPTMVPTPASEPSTRPYEREPNPIRPQCTPSREVLMQYWRMDLARARGLTAHASDAQARRVLGATYKPLMNAIQHGAGTGRHIPDPPESYTKVIVARHGTPLCTKDGCRGAGNGFEPLPGEVP